MNRKVSGFLCCLLAALFWGTTFIAQDVGARTIPPFTYLALRSFVGVAALLPVFLIRDRVRKKQGVYQPSTAAHKKKLILCGVVCGTILCAASALQQFGITGSPGEPGKAAFITALYIVFVPVLGLFFKKKADPHVYVCVLVALGGLWLLCMNGAALTVADTQLIICSLFYAVQMVLVEVFGADVDGIRLSTVQFATVAVLSAVLAVIFEAPTLSGVLEGWWTVLYAGILSTGVAYTLQIIGQQRLPGAIACLVLSLESVVGVLAGMVALRAFPSGREWIGMMLIFAAIMVAQLPVPYGKKQKKGTP
ncbi:MAG: DMT family transporter [Ruminococcaceae bacterium]|nr:DMT family transporter [Oscillospiraceae bacterium]